MTRSEVRLLSRQLFLNRFIIGRRPSPFPPPDSVGSIIAPFSTGCRRYPGRCTQSCGPSLAISRRLASEADHSGNPAERPPQLVDSVALVPAAMGDDGALGPPCDHALDSVPDLATRTPKTPLHVVGGLAVRIGRAEHLHQQAQQRPADTLQLEVLDEVGEDHRA